MGKEIRLFKTEERMKRADVAAFLRQLADKLEPGRVVLRSGQEELTLDVPQNVVLEVQVEEEAKGGGGLQHSLEVELKWREGEDAAGSLELG